jgi:hypothetical protein
VRNLWFPEDNHIYIVSKSVEFALSILSHVWKEFVGTIAVFQRFREHLQLPHLRQKFDRRKFDSRTNLAL